MDADPDITAVAALDEPTRRRLYDYVGASPDAVDRDEAAEALGMRRQTAAFHLDKLVDAGLLTVEFARRNGRRGPGAGRPSKLYRRADRTIAVHLPDRSYELAGHLLAQAVDDAANTGQSPKTALARRASELGHAVGSEAGPTDQDVVAALGRCGYEPRAEGEDIVLTNCPFHNLAQQHTELVCGMNLALVEGLLDGAHCTGRQAHLAPHERYCCVRIEPAG